MGDNWQRAPVYWTPEQTEKLISSLEEKRELWDANDPNHLNERKKETALKAIQDELRNYHPDLTSEDILRKIRSLKSQFQKDLQAIEASKSNCPDFVREPTLWCFDQLKFLIPSETEAEGISSGERENRRLVDQGEIHWSKSNTLKLIELWKAKRELWDVKKTGYQDAATRKAAYKQIRDVMQKHLPNIKAKDIWLQIIKLKEQMQVEFNRMSKEVGVKKKPRLWCFKWLQFLWPTMAMEGRPIDHSQLNVKHILSSVAPRDESSIQGDLKQRCRICFKLISTDTGSLSISAMDFLERELNFTYLTVRNVRPDLPQNVCAKCQGYVESFQRFHERCCKANEFLRLKTLRVKEELHDLDVISENEYLVNYEEVKPGNSTVFVEDIQSTALWNNKEAKMEFLPVDSLNTESMYAENANDKLEVVMDTVHNPERDLDETVEAIVHVENSKSTHTIEKVAKLTTIQCDRIDTDGEESVPNANFGAALLVHNTRSDNNTQVSETRKRYACKSCEKCFKNFYQLCEHERIHTNSKPYVCHVCGKGFRQTSHLNTHLTQHFGKPVECEQCGKRFARKSELIVHNRKHRNERPFKCDFEGCTAAFFRNAPLRDHKLTHSSVRSHVCEFCSCRYHHHNALMMHIKSVHPKVTYKCPECCKCIPQTYSFRKHLEMSHAIKLEDVSHLKITLTERAKRQRGMRKSLKAQQESTDAET